MSHRRGGEGNPWKSQKQKLFLARLKWAVSGQDGEEEEEEHEHEHEQEDDDDGNILIAMEILDLVLGVCGGRSKGDKIEAAQVGTQLLGHNQTFCRLVVL